MGNQSIEAHLKRPPVGNIRAFSSIYKVSGVKNYVVLHKTAFKMD